MPRQPSAKKVVAYGNPAAKCTTLKGGEVISLNEMEIPLASALNTDCIFPISKPKCRV